MIFPLTSPRKETLILTNHKVKDKLVPGVFGFQVYDDIPQKGLSFKESHLTPVNNIMRQHKYAIRQNESPLDLLPHADKNQGINHLFSLAHPLRKLSSESKKMFTGHNGSDINSDMDIDVNAIDFDKDFGDNSVNSSPLMNTATANSVTGKSIFPKPVTDLTEKSIHRKYESETIITNVPSDNDDVSTMQPIYPLSAKKNYTFDEEQSSAGDNVDAKMFNTVGVENIFDRKGNSSKEADSLVKSNDILNITNLNTSSEVDRFLPVEGNVHVKFLNNEKEEMEGQVDRSVDKTPEPFDLVNGRSELSYKSRTMTPSHKQSATFNEKEIIKLGDVGEASNDLFTLNLDDDDATDKTLDKPIGTKERVFNKGPTSTEEADVTLLHSIGDKDYLTL